MNPQKDLAAIAAYKVDERVDEGNILTQYTIPFTVDFDMIDIRDGLIKLGYRSSLYILESVKQWGLFVIRPVQPFERPPVTTLHAAMTTTKGAELASLVADREVLERKIRTALDEFHAAHPGYRAQIDHAQTETDTMCGGKLYGDIIHVKVEVR